MGAIDYRKPRQTWTQNDRGQWRVTIRVKVPSGTDEDGRTVYANKRLSKQFTQDESAKMDTERKRANAADKWIAGLEQADRDAADELARRKAEEEAERERMEAEAEEAARRAATEADPYARMTVSDYVSQFVEGLAMTGDIERSTTKGYRGAARHIEAGFSGVLLRELTASQVKAWRDSLLADGYASSSVTRYMRLLSEALREAVDMDIIAKNPCKAVRAPKRKPPEPNSLTADAYARLARTLAMLQPSPVVTAASIALHTGMRAGEVCGTRWREYDADRRIIHVCEAIGSDGTGKDYTKKPKTLAGTRDVPVPELLAQTLDMRRASMVADLQESGIELDEDEFGKLYICGDARTGGFASPTIIERQFKGLAESFGIEGSRGRRMTMHGLRDSYATLSIQAGADVRSVAGVLGHSNPSITLAAYADSLPEGKRRTSDLLAAIVAAQAPEPFAELAEAE